MSFEIVGVIVVIVGIFSLMRGEHYAVTAFIVASVFAAASASNVTGIGSLQPGHVLLGLSAAMTLTKQENSGRLALAISFPRAGFWLLCTMVYGLIGAYFFPRMLGASVLVNPIQGGIVGGYSPVSLQPTGGNLTQSIYFSADILCFIVCSTVSSTSIGFNVIVRAILLYCLTDITIALLDIATYATNTTFLLDFIRNANYVIYVDTDSSNLKRIVGSFSETSAFSSATLGVFGFSSQLWLENFLPRLTSAIAACSLALLLASTSTTAYVGLVAGITFTGLYLIIRMIRGDATNISNLTVIMAPMIVICVVLGIMLNDQLYDRLREFFEMMVFNKGQSQSGLERGQINISAWQSFLQSGGLGTGVGSVRASSFVLAVLANMGVVGTLLYGVSLSVIFLSKTKSDNDQHSSVRRAARSACVYLLIPALISGALIDLGLPFFVFAALVCAKPKPNERLRPAGTDARLVTSS